MALSNEDKKDVSGAMGKAMANKISKVTRDELRKDGLSDRKRSGMMSYNTHAKHNPKTGFLELSKDAPKRAHNYYDKLGSSKSKALSSKKEQSYSEALRDTLTPFHKLSKEKQEAHFKKARPTSQTAMDKRIAQHGVYTGEKDKKRDGADEYVKSLGA
tara:strand:+ start:564 stop:1037 length:474 start_codon:yes stop_codon:yes gene_type:complete